MEERRDDMIVQGDDGLKDLAGRTRADRLKSLEDAIELREKRLRALLE
jgi:hypothetical protein